MRTVEVYEIRTTLPIKEIAQQFREGIVKPRNRALRVVGGTFDWTFFTPESAEVPFAQFAAEGDGPTYVVAAYAVRPQRAGTLRQTTVALPGNTFLLQIWDRGDRRDVRLEAPAAQAWRSYTSNFVNQLTGKDPGSRVKQSSE